MLVFASISLKMRLATGAPHRTPLGGLQRSPDPKVGSSQKCRGARPRRQHSQWVIVGKVRKRLKTPAIGRHTHARTHTQTHTDYGRITP